MGCKSKPEEHLGSTSTAVTSEGAAILRTCAIAIVPGISSNASHVCDPIAFCQHPAHTAISLHNILALQGVVHGHHGLHPWHLHHNQKRLSHVFWQGSAQGGIHEKHGLPAGACRVTGHFQSLKASRLHYTAAQAQDGPVRGLAVKATTVCKMGWSGALLAKLPRSAAGPDTMWASQLVAAAHRDAAEKAHALAP